MMFGSRSLVECGRWVLLWVGLNLGRALQSPLSSSCRCKLPSGHAHNHRTHARIIVGRRSMYHLSTTSAPLGRPHRQKFNLSQMAAAAAWAPAAGSCGQNRQTTADRRTLKAVADLSLTGGYLLFLYRLTTPEAELFRAWTNYVCHCDCVAGLVTENLELSAGGRRDCSSAVVVRLLITHAAMSRAAKLVYGTSQPSQRRRWR
ncbi:uncharacterized protein V1518DRAFT_419808 [Limtongia smithiae]|uniref:uncharacterized protein n=1 Tax=Limtongia smithiae TaxID=1125753 RepID=UPI0034CDD2A5